MLKKYRTIILGILIIVVLAIALHYTTKKEVFTIQGSEYNIGSVVVLAIQPPKDTVKHPKSTDQSKYIANGTLFLLMKNHNKLFFLPSFQQIATFSPQNLFHKKSPIFSYLFLGVYHAEDNSIHYLSLDDANIDTLYFYKKCLSPEQVVKLNQEIEAVKYLSGSRYLDAGSLTYRTKNGENRTLLVGHWIYQQSLLGKVHLKYDKKDMIRKQFNLDYQSQLKAIRNHKAMDLNAMHEATPKK